ncbi:MAG: large subunit ribosomal protein L18 [Parcubacteria group bacterium Gr01-1014_38]|nr:MAG: large subunit ribosomal protein L18 [Parcubacteria group bacterium Gr01-1014_38]
MSHRVSGEERAQARRRRVRARVIGTAERPRMSVFRSLKHVSVQLIDDTASRTLLGVSDRHLPKAAHARHRSGAERAKAVGTLVAERAREKGISAVVFDRGRYAYAGQVKAVAEGAREGGLVF